MSQLFTNNASTLLDASISNVDTVITVTAGDGALFSSPSNGDYQLITLTDPSSPADIEIVKLTARTGDSLTVTRGQEGTTAIAFTAGTAEVSARLTAGTLANGVFNTSSVATCLSLRRSSDTGTGFSSVADLPEWTASTSVTLGDVRRKTGSSTHLIFCVDGGTTGTVEPSWPTYNTAAIYDGSAVWSAYNTQSPVEADQFILGDNVNAYDESVTAIGRDVHASGRFSTAVGTGALASGNSTSLGDAARAGGYSSVAIGANSLTTSRWSTAVGGRATSGERSVQLGQEYWNDPSITGGAAGSVGISSGNYQTLPYSLTIGAANFIGLHDEWYLGNSPGDHDVKTTIKFHNTAETTLYSCIPMQLGDATWAATTSYKHGQSVRPTTPNGFVYTAYVWTGNQTPDYFDTATSGGSEPTWPTSAGSTVSDGDITWYCVDPAAYYFSIGTSSAADRPAANMIFIPTKVGVLTYGCTPGGSVTYPQLSFGVEGNLAKWLGTTTFSKLTGNYSLHEFEVTNTEGVATTGQGTTASFGFSLATAGTDLDCSALPYVKGYFVEDVL